MMSRESSAHAIPVLETEAFDATPFLYTVDRISQSQTFE